MLNRSHTSWPPGTWNIPLFQSFPLGFISWKHSSKKTPGHTDQWHHGGNSMKGKNLAVPLGGWHLVLVASGEFRTRWSHCVLIWLVYSVLLFMNAMNHSYYTRLPLIRQLLGSTFAVETLWNPAKCLGEWSWAHTFQHVSPPLASLSVIISDAQDPYFRRNCSRTAASAIFISWARCSTQQNFTASPQKKN